MGGSSFRSQAVTEPEAKRNANQRGSVRRCPDAREGVAFYRGRYAEHRAVRGLETPHPAGRKPRNCADAHYLAEVWPTRSYQARKATEAWLIDQRTLEEQTSWQAAIREVQPAYPGSDVWIDPCSRSEGSGASGEQGFVMNREGSGASGWMQFMPSTFWRMYYAAVADLKARGFIIVASSARITSRIGQAMAAGWAWANGRTHEWHGANC